MVFVIKAVKSTIQPPQIASKGFSNSDTRPQYLILVPSLYLLQRNLPTTKAILRILGFALSEFDRTRDASAKAGVPFHAFLAYHDGSIRSSFEPPPIPKIANLPVPTHKTMAHQITSSCVSRAVRQLRCTRISALSTSLEHVAEAHCNARGFSTLRRCHAARDRQREETPNLPLSPNAVKDRIQSPL